MAERQKAPHPGQLGLFDAPPPQAAPAAEPAATPKIAAGEAPEGAPERMAALDTSPWSAPESIYPREGRSGVLAAACAIQNADLARQLLALDVRWNLDEPYGPDQASAASLLMRQGSVNGWRSADPDANPDEAPTLDEASRVVLAMVERGADFLLEDSRGQSALSLAAMRKREAFIQALAGHPDFIAQRLAHVRVGRLAPAQEGQPAPKDTRHGLLSHLVFSGQVHALKALVQSAGMKLNELDPQGRLPIGHCRDPRVLEALLALGADPKLEDAHGLNALARAQEASDTSTREKLTTRIAQEFKRSLNADPAALAALQEQNIAALLEAAENAPKSSMLKTIAAFKFDPAKARDPKTGMTPLMAALKGGRSASVNYLLERGCSLNDADAQGLRASSRLLSSPYSSNGPNPVDTVRHFAGQIDFEPLSARGWPVAVEAAFLLARGKANEGYRYQDTGTECFATAIAERSAWAKPSWFVAPDGPSICEAYALGEPTHHNALARLKKLFDIEREHCPQGAIDRGVAALIAILTSKVRTNFHQYAGQANAAQEIERLFLAHPEPMPRSAAALAKAQREQPLKAAEFVSAHPVLAAAIEAAELSAASQAASPKRAGARL